MGQILGGHIACVLQTTAQWEGVQLKGAGAGPSKAQSLGNCEWSAYLLWLFSKYFTYTDSFNPRNSSVEKTPLASPQFLRHAAKE